VARSRAGAVPEQASGWSNSASQAHGQSTAGSHKVRDANVRFELANVVGIVAPLIVTKEQYKLTYRHCWHFKSVTSLHKFHHSLCSNRDTRKISTGQGLATELCKFLQHPNFHLTLKTSAQSTYSDSTHSLWGPENSKNQNGCNPFKALNSAQP
jgi:hypothetical protein